MCVIYVNMKTAIIREAQHYPFKVIAEIENGEKIVSTRRSKNTVALEVYFEKGGCHREQIGLGDYLS